MFLRKTPQAETFEEIIKPHVDLLYKTAYRLTGNRDEAEDLVQEILTKLYPKTAEMQKVEALGPWLKKVVYRQFIDGIRKTSRTPENKLTHDGTELEEIANPVDNPHILAERAELREKLQAALDSLDKQHRLVVVLHLAEGHTLTEISEICDIPVETIKTQLRRAKVRLKNILKM